MGYESGGYKFVKILGYVLPGTDYTTYNKTGFVFNFDFGGFAYSHKFDLTLRMEVLNRFSSKRSTLYYRSEVSNPVNHKLQNFEVPEDYEVLNAKLDIRIYYRLFTKDSWEFHQSCTLYDITNDGFPYENIRIPFRSTSYYIKQRSISYNKQLFYTLIFTNPV